MSFWVQGNSAAQVVKRIVEIRSSQEKLVQHTSENQEFQTLRRVADPSDAVRCTAPQWFQRTWEIDKLGTPPLPHVFFSSCCFSTTCVEEALRVDEECVKHLPIIQQVARVCGNRPSTSSDRIRGSGTYSDGCSFSSIGRARHGVPSCVDFLHHKSLVHFVAPDC